MIPGAYALPDALFFSAAQLGVRCVLSLWESLGLGLRLGLGLGINQDLTKKKKPQSVPQKKLTPPG